MPGPRPASHPSLQAYSKAICFTSCIVERGRDTENICIRTGGTRQTVLHVWFNGMLEHAHLLHLFAILIGSASTCPLRCTPSAPGQLLYSRFALPAITTYRFNLFHLVSFTVQPRGWATQGRRLPDWSFVKMGFPPQKIFLQKVGCSHDSRIHLIAFRSSILWD